MIRHPLAWCAWSVAALAIAFIDRNPFLQGLVLLVILNTWLPYRRSHALHLRVGLVLAATPVLFSIALSRFGEHIIVVLPAVPIVGGPWTWEALVFGASSGLALLLTVGIFGILQSTVRSADLLPLLPRPLYRAGTVFALSLTFAPKTISSFHSIREARQVRGQRTGWRAAPSLVVPLLLTTLEQALQYAESLDARGYGSRRRSRYRPLPWSAGDLIVTAASLAAMGITVAFATAPYNPYGHLAPSLPSSVSVVSVLLLALPAMAAAIPRMEHAPHHV
jgi:energy-coupling factor transport system permease protein